MNPSMRSLRLYLSNKTYVVGVPVPFLDHSLPAGAGVSEVRPGEGRRVLQGGEREDGGVDQGSDCEVGPGGAVIETLDFQRSVSLAAMPCGRQLGFHS